MSVSLWFPALLVSILAFAVIAHRAGLYGSVKLYKLDDRVYIKNGMDVSARNPNPEVWVIRDYSEKHGYHLIREGRCTTIIGRMFWDKDLRDASDAPPTPPLIIPKNLQPHKRARSYVA